MAAAYTVSQFFPSPGFIATFIAGVAYSDLRNVIKRSAAK
jgi:hypothetical protein